MSRYTMADHSATFFKAVASYDEEHDDTVIPNGAKWIVCSFTGCGAQTPGTIVKLIWDPAGTPEVLAATHGDVSMILNKQITGDGSKVLRLQLENDTGSIETIGGQWEAQDM